MNKTSHLIVASVIMMSCAARQPAPRIEAGHADAGERFFAAPVVGTDGSLEIAARVRLELPRYRIRGTCGIIWSPEGYLQIDFDHSSLFGSYREEATITVAGGSLSIQDHRRGTYTEDDEVLNLLAEQFGLEVWGDDLIYLLLLRPLRFDDHSPVSIEERRDGTVTISGRWRGRDLEVTGRQGAEIGRIRLCAPGGVCYETRYGYAEDRARGYYPRRIVCESRGNGRRIALTIESVERFGPGAAIKKNDEREPASARGVPSGERRYE